ncbi:MAG: hypothetical protein Q9174_000025 [Haloplaca sp. 1 TL-2023]
MAYRMCAKAAADVPLADSTVRRSSPSYRAPNADTEMDKELSNGRVLRTAGDLTLLLDVYESQGKYDEALDVLEDPRTGIHSKVAGRSFSFVLRMVKLLAASKRWKTLFKFCFEVLYDGRLDKKRPDLHGFGETGNDWAVWVGLYQAVKHLPPDEGIEWDTCFPNEVAPEQASSNPVVDLWLIAAMLCSKYGDEGNGAPRNSLCAGMLFCSGNLKYRGNKRWNQTALLTEASSYFSLDGDKAFCFNDLRLYLPNLHPEDVGTFVENMAKVIKDRERHCSHKSSRDVGLKLSMMKTNKLKLEYYLIYSKNGVLKASERKGKDAVGVPFHGPPSSVDTVDDINRSTSTKEMEQFVVRCITLFASRSQSPVDHHHRTDRVPEDDAGILAVAALIRLYHLGNRQNALLRAATLLQHVIDVSPSNYEALVLMTMICSTLGNGWGAAEYFNRLAVKNIQIPTVSWLLCTRISTIHPHTPQRHSDKASAEQAENDPVAYLSAALAYHAHLPEISQREMLDFLQSGRYAGLERVISDGDRNQNGFVKYLLLIEFARTVRLSGSRQKLDYHTLAGKYSIPTSILDNRDKVTVPHWEHPTSRSLCETISPGKMPKNAWLFQQLMIASVFNKSEAGNSSFQPDEVQNNLYYPGHSVNESSAHEEQQFQLAVNCMKVLDLFSAHSPETVFHKKQSENMSRLGEALTDIESNMVDSKERLLSMGARKGEYLYCLSSKLAVPDWKFFHAVYTAIDSLVLVRRIMDQIEAHARTTRGVDSQWAIPMVRKIRQLCSECHTMVNTKAQDLGKQIADPEFEEAMVQSIIGPADDVGDPDLIAAALQDSCRKPSVQFERNDPSSGTPVVYFTVQRLCQAWAQALRNVEKLTAAPSI